MGLTSAPKSQKCPYGWVPVIEKIGDTDWTINGHPRLHGHPDCQIIMINADACKTCPLAERQPDAPPSDFLQHLLQITELQAAGAQFNHDALEPIEWQGLIVLKHKREQKQSRDLERERQRVQASRQLPKSTPQTSQ